LAKTPAEIQEILEKTRAPKRRAILARLLQIKEGETAELFKIASEAGTRAATVRKLAKLGLITITAEPDFDMPPAYYPRSGEEEEPPKLNEDQVDVMRELEPRIGGGEFSVNLLHGVTGSGKTEIYLRCIKRAVELGKRAIVLVPEIALTPQTGGRLIGRFPNHRVAVLHSGLTAAQRNQQWAMVHEGAADIVLGARSAVFAPIPEGRLGLIVVDEEHDGSYKQDQVPRYHGRDVAIRRAQLAECPIVLGSATPSLESWFNATQRQNYRLHRLTQRAPGLTLPKVRIVDFREQMKQHHDRRVHLLGTLMDQAIAQTLDGGVAGSRRRGAARELRQHGQGRGSRRRCAGRRASAWRAWRIHR